MKVIYKYKIPHGEKEFSLKVAKEDKILSLHSVDGVPTLWILTTPDNEKSSMFYIVMTGEKFEPNEDEFIGTYNVDWLVLHLFRKSQ